MTETVYGTCVWSLLALVDRDLRTVVGSLDHAGEKLRLRAQGSGDASIVGEVSDSSGAVLPGATVVAVEPRTLGGRSSYHGHR